jgi:signal transduction histidine kinase
MSKPSRSTPPRTPMRSLGLFGIALALVVGGLIVWDLLDSRRGLVAQTEEEALETARLIAEHTARSLDTVNLVLHTFAATVPGRDISRSGRGARQRLEELLVDLPQVRSFRVIDANGVPLLSAGPTESLPDRVGEADYLERHAAAPLGYLTIGAPRADGDGWTIPVSRRISLPDGGFGGVVVANLHGAYFRDLYARALGGLDTHAMALWRTDGLMLARFPETGGRGPGEVTLPHEDVAGLAKGFQVIHGESPVDGRVRIVGIGPVPGVPLAVTVAVDRRAMMAAWRESAWRHGAVLVAVLLLLGIGLRTLGRSFARAQAAAAQRQAAVESSLHGYFFLTAVRNHHGEIVDFVFQDMNRRAEQMMNRPRAFWIGERLCDVMPINRSEGFFERYKAVVETGEPFEYEFSIDTPELKPEWMRIQVQQLDDGVVIAARDITEEKGDEMARQIAERSLGDIAESVPGMVYQFAIGPDGRQEFRFVSQGVQDLYGLSVEEATGDAATLMSFVDPRDLPYLENTIAHSMATGEPWEADYRILPDNRVRWLRGRSRPQFEPDGGVVWNGVVIDVTEEREAQAATMRAREEAEFANRAKSDFLANMSHELRTPLNAIIGFAEALQHGLGGPLSPRQDDYLNHVHSAGRHLLGIINDVLDLAKIEAGQAELDEDTVNLEDTVGAAVALVSGKAQTKHIRLDCAVLASLPKVHGDGRRLKQVMLNLMSNAIKFTPEQGAVRVGGAVGADGWLRITVDDSGPGMDAEEIAVALSPFGQVGDSFVRAEGGTGLGLPLSVQMLELHGGRLEIESEPGGGTRVTVLLPPERLLVEARELEVEAPTTEDRPTPKDESAGPRLVHG